MSVVAHRDDAPRAPHDDARCPWCGATAATTIHRIADWDIRRCAQCALARIHPYPSMASRAEFYSAPAIAQRKEHKRRGPGKRLAAWIRHWLRKWSGRTKGSVFVRELQRRLPPGGAVLDIGCGTGAFLKEARHLYHCTGIEISEHLATEARKLGVDVVVGDFCDYPFAERQFDAITLISLIEHLHTPREALQRCHALLAERGVLLLKTVNHGGLNRRLLGAQWSGYRPPDHLVYFDPHTLRRALVETGFREVTIHAPLINDSFYCYAVK